MRTGRFDEADRLLEVALDRSRHSTLASAYRVRGLLAARREPAIAAALFAESSEHAEQSAQPFPRALLALQTGAHLRRQGQRKAAIAQLRESEATMEALGAAPFIGLIETELGACGQSPRRRQPGADQQLTNQELTVARLVAQGLTNREVAAQLVLSQKTVEFHLRNVYVKLGVRSRVQLANVIRPTRTTT